MNFPTSKKCTETKNVIFSSHILLLSGRAYKRKDHHKGLKKQKEMKKYFNTCVHLAGEKTFFPQAEPQSFIEKFILKSTDKLSKHIQSCANMLLNKHLKNLDRY